jgi:hypothetical protein
MPPAQKRATCGGGTSGIALTAKRGCQHTCTKHMQCKPPAARGAVCSCQWAKGGMCSKKRTGQVRSTERNSASHAGEVPTMAKQQGARTQQRRGTHDTCHELRCVTIPTHKLNRRRSILLTGDNIRTKCRLANATHFLNELRQRYLKSHGSWPMRPVRATRCKTPRRKTCLASTSANGTHPQAPCMPGMKQGKALAMHVIALACWGHKHFFKMSLK